jgi:type 2 lantibiotic biosynthesis protein LanM
MGDAHKGGRSVLIATFASGWRVVYKPRPLAIDACFNALLQYLNEAGQSPILHSPRVIARAEYGWVQHVEMTECDSSEAIERFYLRIGALTAILRTLEATDFHLENVIASGEHPMLVDLEGLLHPRAQIAPNAGNGQALGWELIGRSVLRVGLLPTRAFMAGGYEGVELSGFGGAAGQLSPSRQLAFDNVGRDEMKVVRRQVPMPGSKNRPQLHGEDVDPAAYVHHVIDGFTSTYRCLMRCAHDLLASNGLLGRFASAPVRAILRSTRFYALLLQEGSHPDALRDALERERLFDWVWAAYDAQPHLRPFMHAEHADLCRGDIPLFTSLPGRRDVWTAEGVCVENVWHEASIDAARRNLATLSEDDLALQVWFIASSLSAFHVGDQTAAFGASPSERDVPRRAVFTGPCPESMHETAHPLDQRLIVAAHGIGDYLARSALRDGDAIGWLGLQLHNERVWAIEPVGNDLYGGLPGIALFLGYLASVSPRADLRTLARVSAQQVAQNVRASVTRGLAKRESAPIGLFTEWGGCVYALSHLSVLWDDPELANDALQAARRIAEHVARDEALDVIGGAAGAIMAMASLYAVVRDDAVLDVVVRAADHLLSRAQTMACGIAWRTSISSTSPLAGISHGASGMALALAVAAQLTGDERYETAAREAMLYEDSIFDHASGNWPDYRVLSGTRDATERPSSLWAWCHGAPGIGIARARLLMLGWSDSGILNDIDRAVRSTSRFGFGMNHSLCHGDLGNLELFSLLPSDRRNRDVAVAVATQLESMLLRASTYGWQCGVPHAVPTPGLMTGLAGVGYGLLRSALPGVIPSLLAMEPPRRPNGPQSFASALA